MIKVRDIEEKVFNLTMQFTVAEQKVREATNDEEWGPHGALMDEIAEMTKQPQHFPEVCNTLFFYKQFEYPHSLKIFLDFSHFLA